MEVGMLNCLSLLEAGHLGIAKCHGGMEILMSWGGARSTRAGEASGEHSGLLGSPPMHPVNLAQSPHLNMHSQSYRLVGHSLYNKEKRTDESPAPRISLRFAGSSMPVTAMENPVLSGEDERIKAELRDWRLRPARVGGRCRKSLRCLGAEMIGRSRGWGLREAEWSKRHTCAKDASARCGLALRFLLLEPIGRQAMLRTP